MDRKKEFDPNPSKEAFKSETLKLNGDWFDNLNKTQQKDILEGLAEADRGETVPHSEALKLFGKYGLQ